MAVAAFRAWHTLNLTVKLDTRTRVAKQPLFNNKHVLLNNAPIEPSTNEKAVADLFESLPLGYLYTPKDYPNQKYYRLKSPTKLNEYEDINVNPNIWRVLLSKIPPNLHEILCGKDDKPIAPYWGALECNKEVGDVYFYYEETTKEGRKVKCSNPQPLH